MGEPIVHLSDGKIRGITGENIYGKTIYKFLGVPYGEPPTGDLRFKAPQPAKPWKDIKETTKDGDACFHREPGETANDGIQGSENCLVLNVFTRNITSTGSLKPVMVFIHGGCFTMGSNNSVIYGPEFLLMEDIVIVVINYRLGLFGFLSLEDESLDVPGNAGLKDGRLALQWVQRNIEMFGGDPNNVTIFGESAGAFLVHFLILSKSGKGLFHKAILQSGVSLMPSAVVSPNGQIVAEALGKKSASDHEILNTLKNMTCKELLAIQEKIPDMEKLIIVKDYMKNCEGFGTTSRKVEFKLKPIPNNIEPVNWLKEAITQIVLKSAESLEPTDMVGFTFCSRNLERGKGWLRFQEASKVTVEEVWGVLNGIFQSNSSGIDTDTFCLEVTRVRLPKKKHGKEYFSLN